MNSAKFPLAFFLLVLTGAFPVKAADYSWNNGSGGPGAPYEDPVNWLVDGSPPAAPPGETDNIITPAVQGRAALNADATINNFFYDSTTVNSRIQDVAGGGVTTFTINGDATVAGTSQVFFTNLGGEGLSVVIHGNITKSSTSTLNFSPLITLTVDGTTTVDDGTVNIQAAAATFGPIVVNSGNFRVFQQGTGTGGITAAGLSGAGGLVQASSSGTSNGVLTIDTTGSNSYTFSGTLQNGAASAPLRVVKNGTGTQTFGGNSNTYTGGTDINGGRLLVTNTSGSGLGTGNVTVDGGILGGTGFITLNSGNSVTVAAGAALLGGDGVLASGTLTINNDVTLADGSSILLTLGAAGTHSSLARAGGNWTFDFDQIFFFLGDLEAGTYANIITGLDSDPGVTNWTVANSGWEGGMFSYDSGNVSLTLVPEPSVWLLAGVGTLLVLVRRRRPARFVDR